VSFATKIPAKWHKNAQNITQNMVYHRNKDKGEIESAGNGGG